MGKLIHANWARVIRNKVFWIVEIFLIGYSIFAYTMGADNARNFGMDDSEWSLYFFHEILFIHAVTAVFLPFFIGVDYSDGTIRNKLVAGHTRKALYLSNFITCYMVGLIQFVTYSVTSFLAGLLLAGTSTYTGITHPLWRIGYSMIIILSYSAIFSMIAMLDMNKARVAVVELLLVFVFVMLMSQIYTDLLEPERTDRVVISETGELMIEQDVPNSKYITGTKRVVYEWIDAFLPADQAMYVIDGDASFSMKAPICLFVESLLMIGVGMYVFQRKDIK